ncbi:hypothetical protein QBC47DRAFT_385938 [Echria macrotheca]|uniref:Uncharacterized protein n=1 Tax=Echria macrotheca TaxID=438768 RepID=A0AAJ0B9J9_9PEZI|nr:hypothetical protein QBC47DRAFT_385938 [Echria macrotheca]
MKIARDRAGRPLTEPKQPRWMRHHGTKAKNPDSVDGYIIRILLANGYWAYRPEQLAHLTGNQPHQIFVGGHYFRPRIILTYGVGMYHRGRVHQSRPDCRRIGLDRDYNAWETAWYYNELPRQEHRKERLVLRRLAERRLAERRHATRIEPEQSDLTAKDTTPTASQPHRHRVTDDPMQDGLELAAAENLRLPSDRQLSGSGTRSGVRIISRDEKEIEDALRCGVFSDEVGELSLNSIVHDEPAYSIRFVPTKRKRKTLGCKDEEINSGMPVAVSSEIMPLEIDDGLWDEILSELEAQGWVPVVGSDMDQDELVSVAESWVVMKGKDS